VERELKDNLLSYNLRKEKTGITIMKNKKLKTLLPCCLLLVGGVSGLTSCGEKSQVGELTSDDIYITFWHTFSYDAQLEVMLAQFNEIYPNIHVDLVKQSTDYSGLKDLITQGIPADSYPNMALCYPDHVADYLSTGKVIQMDQYMEDPEYGWTKEDFDDILPNLLATGQNLQVEGTWCLPFAASSEALYYNSDALIGLNLSGIDSSINEGKALDTDYFNSLTWEELFDHLFPALEKAITDESYGSSLYGYINTESDYYGLLGYDSDDNLFITLAEQYGYDYTSVSTTTGKGQILFNNDDMKGLMKTFNAQHNTESIPYICTQGTCGGYTDTYYCNDAFLFTVGSTGGVKYQTEGQFVSGAARIPQAEGHEEKCICQGPSICFFDHNDDQEALACWLFYKFITSAQNTCYWATETGYMPIRESAYTLDDWLDWTSTEGKSGADLTYVYVYSLYADIASSLFTSPAFKGSAEARTQAGSIMTQCLLSTDIDKEIDSIFENAENQAKLAL
ncbi:MAG: extracellular solute-binding protein, partial [Coprobacillus sp.]|nr:extracellular solute-binding protein [Coprobacillus sp.]